MTAVNRWDTTDAGNLTQNYLLRAKITLAIKATSSTATAAVGDYYEFPCTVRNLPNLADNPTWSVLTDDPNDLCGRKYTGKSEGFDAIEFQMPAVFGIHQELELHRISGDVFTLSYTYDNPTETKIHTLSLPKCQIIGIQISGGEVNAASTMTVKIQPMGGVADNMITFTSTTRSAG